MTGSAVKCHFHFFFFIPKPIGHNVGSLGLNIILYASRFFCWILHCSIWAGFFTFVAPAPHNFTVHPSAVWLVQSEPDLLIVGPGPCGQLCMDCPQPFVRNGVQLA